MIELFTTAFITLAVIIDPPGCAPIFASLTKGASAAHRRSMAIRSAAVAWCILVFFGNDSIPVQLWQMQVARTVAVRGSPIH